MSRLKYIIVLKLINKFIPWNNLMNTCRQCDQPQEDLNARCPYCGSLNQKIDNILAKEAAEAEKNSFKGKLKSILNADNKTKALFIQINTTRQSLPKQAWLTFFVIFMFIFAMTYTVI